MPRNMSPNSLANLTPNLAGTKPRYGDRKKKRNIVVTDKSWEAVKPMVKEQYGLSISEMVELIGRGKYVLTKVEKAS